MHKAFRKGNVSAVRSLLEKRANLEERSYAGDTQVDEYASFGDPYRVIKIRHNGTCETISGLGRRIYVLIILKESLSVRSLLNKR